MYLKLLLGDLYLDSKAHGEAVLIFLMQVKRDVLEYGIWRTGARLATKNWLMLQLHLLLSVGTENSLACKFE